MVSVSFKETAVQPDQRPGLPRSGHSAAQLPSGDVLVFGGYTEDADKQRAPSNEAWLFSAAAGAWRPVTFSSPEVPATRLVSQAVVIGNKLWLIGGWDSSKTGPAAFLGDVWTLDLDSWAWTRVEPQGETLEPISRFQAVAVDQRIFIHTHRTEDHILVLDTATQPPTLQKVPVTGPAPSSRGLHSMVRVGRGLYVFGGAPQKGPMLDDLWRFDLDSLAWARLNPSGPSPHARCSSAAAAVGDRYIVYVGGAFYGASGGLEMLQDVVVYDTVDNSWVAPDVVGGVMPSGRNAAVMVSLPGSDAAGAAGPHLLLFGGWKAFVESYNDTYLITVRSG